MLQRMVRMENIVVAILLARPRVPSVVGRRVLPIDMSQLVRFSFLDVFFNQEPLSA